ncbi:skin secretory protein xP2-like [Brachypodium distachyon]|uniref:skin secretory protein xP2-like n=1 Tax=Brachypodium distachyon TaxID=15368 RepID=UPI00052FF551|nr:skin secretory protein xP2-like [Brachypodium distachyon]|eukprot:XP_010240745.1 skin secretory protein xP2-like [Brachypodium distachyon]
MSSKGQNRPNGSTSKGEKHEKAGKKELSERARKDAEMQAKFAFFSPRYNGEGVEKLVLALATKHNEHGLTQVLPVGAERDPQYFRIFGRFILAGPHKGKEPAAESGKGGQDRGSARPEDLDSDDSSLGIGGDSDDDDDDAPLEAGGVALEEDDDDDDIPVVRRSAAERAGRREASPQPQAPLVNAGTVASANSGAAAAAIPATLAAPPIPPARSTPPARSILPNRVLKLNPPGSSRKRGQASTLPAAPAKKPRPASGGGDKDAADAAVTATAAAAGDTRVPDPSLQGTGPAAVAGDVPATPAPTEVQVIDLTGEADDDAPEEVASAGTLQQPALKLAGDATAAAGDATQTAPSAVGDMRQPLPARANSDALEKPSSPQPATLDGQGVAGLSQAGGASPNPDAASGSQTVIDNIQQQQRMFVDFFNDAQQHHARVVAELGAALRETEEQHTELQRLRGELQQAQQARAAPAVQGVPEAEVLQQLWDLQQEHQRELDLVKAAHT